MYSICDDAWSQLATLKLESPDVVGYLMEMPASASVPPPLRVVRGKRPKQHPVGHGLTPFPRKVPKAKRRIPRMAVAVNVGASAVPDSWQKKKNGRKKKTGLKEITAITEMFEGIMA